MKTSNSSNWALMLSKTVLTVVFSLCFFCLSAEEYKVTIKAGKLKSALKGKEDVTKLTISGKMNGSDFLYIRELSTLLELDLTNVSIVSGGKAYLEKKLSQRERMDFRDNLRNKDALSTLILLGKSGFSENKKYKVTEADVLPDFVFSGKSNLQKIVLPKGLVKVKQYALGTNNNNLVVQFTSQNPPQIETQLLDANTNTDSVDDILNKSSSDKMIKDYFSIKSTSKNNPYAIWNKVIVPANRYSAYKSQLDERLYESMVKDNAPSEYTISLDDKHLKSELDGGYSFVKRLTLSGNMNMRDLQILSQLSNLRYLDMRDVVIKDDNFSTWLSEISKRDIGNLLDDIDKYAKSSGLISLNDTISYYSILKNVISVDSSFLSLMKEKKVLLSSLSDLKSKKTNLPKEKKKAEDEQGQRAFLALLLGMSDDVLEKQYEHEEISTMDYISNKMFGSALKEELEKEMQQSDLTDPNVYARISNEIDKGIAVCKQQIEQLETRIQPIENKIRTQLEDFHNTINEGSIIPSRTFVGLWHLQKVILPLNTVLIGDHAFMDCTEAMEVEVNSDVIQLGVMKN
ncbi:leucine-rich repeat protein [Parabacteroides sp. An277]|uniref:leucine-rich repeat protein n=1 Tax=Parabacteroides sp. An277 TaxID=1965619 RepID=UPI0013A68000|nr:leucine-rich repeat protein [Parabacteroides sp. An277]